MRDKRPVDELSIEELERILAIKRREARQKQLQRMKQSGRLVAAGTPTGEDHPPEPAAAPPSPVAGVPVSPKTPSAVQKAAPPPVGGPGAPRFEDDALFHAGGSAPLRGAAEADDPWRRFVNRLLLVVELVAIVGLVYLGITMFGAIDTLQDETAAAQEMVSSTQMASVPTLEPTPVLHLNQVVLPAGHVFVENGTPRFNFAEIPAHLLPAVQSELTALVIERPVRTPETARIVTIPRLQLEAPIIQGVDWEALRAGVGQVLNGAKPGDPTGNVVLAAHNDIYGELFRYLDQLETGDKVFVQTETQTYSYTVTRRELHDPTDIHVMDNQGRPTLTLISCYPYQVNSQRIVVFAERDDNFQTFSSY